MLDATVIGCLRFEAFFTFNFLKDYVYLAFCKWESSMKAKAAVIFPSLNYLGGAVRVCLGFIKVLSKAGYEVTLFTVDKTRWNLIRRVLGDFGDLRFKEHFIISRFPKFFDASLRNISLALFYILEVLAVRFFLRFDIVLVVGGELVDCLGDVVYINALPFRLEHSFPNKHFGRSSIWKSYSRIYDAFMKLLSRVDSKGLLLTNSHFLRDIILEKTGRDSIVVYPPVETGKFMSNEGEQRLNLVVTVSRLHPGKSLNVVLEVAKLVDGAKFLIIGSSSGRFEEALSELNEAIKRMNLEGKVIMMVNEPSSKLVEVLSKAKVLLHTQPTEAFGMVVVEAMAAGCVPVVPSSGGPWNDILDRRQGVYGFSYKNVSEAADIITLMLNNEDLRREVAERARVRALCFDKSVFEERILSIINAIK